MRILQPFEKKIRHSIRDELARKPTLTMAALKEQLEKEYGRDFHHTYTRKLVGKVRNELSYEIDSAKIEPRLAFSRENYRLMREELLKIVYWKPGDNEGANGMARPAAKDRVEAAKSVVMLDLALLNAEMANGIYRKSPEELARSTIPTSRWNPRCARSLSVVDARRDAASGDNRANGARCRSSVNRKIRYVRSSQAHSDLRPKIFRTSSVNSGIANRAAE